MVVYSLFDYTGAMVEPWRRAGALCICIDTQHSGKLPRHVEAGITYKVGYDIHGIMRYSRNWPQPDIVFGFPPCTDLAVSGARWFADKAALDPDFQLRAVALARTVETFGEHHSVPWMLENPVSRLSTLWRKPDYWFHPWQFADLCPDDNYTKKTGIWCGRGFVMPKGLDKPLALPDDRIHKAPPGAGRANFRSATPRGFSEAVFSSNYGSIRQ